MKNILVTGMSGYLGNSFTSEYSKKYKYIKFSLFSDKIEEINFVNVDVVLHCAALVHQKEIHKYSSYYDVNVKYPYDLAAKAKENGVKQFIFISTIAVYGNDIEIIDEDTETNPVTPYGISKLEAEKKLFELNDESFTVTIVRPPMIYGSNAPGNIDTLVNLIRKVPILPFSNINNKRSFIYIENLCSVIDELINTKKSGIFLISDKDSLSTTKLCELISLNLNKKLYLIRIPLFETFLKLVKPDLHSKLFGNLEINSNDLKLDNFISVEEGIKKMIKGEK